MSTTNLKDIILGDLAAAVTPDSTPVVLPAGVHTMKILGFTEEPTYSYVTVEVDRRKFNFFYNFLIRDTNNLNAEVINWFKELATVTTTEKTTLLEIANSAIGSSYEIEVYNYVSKSGKNAGTTQHAIKFSTLPVLAVNTVEIEELELPI